MEHHDYRDDRIYPDTLVLIEEDRFGVDAVLERGLGDRTLIRNRPWVDDPGDEILMELLVIPDL